MESLSLARQLVASVMEREFKQHGLALLHQEAANSLDWIETVLDVLGEAEVVQAVNRVNRENLTSGHEIVLGRCKDGTNCTIEFLTELRFRHLCVDAECAVGGNAATPMQAALAGGSGVHVGYDYRPHPVHAMYTHLSCQSKGPVGLVYKIDRDVVKESSTRHVSQVVNEINRRANTRFEVLLGRHAPNDGALQFLSNLRWSKGARDVEAWDALPMRKALNYSEGVQRLDDYRPAPVISAFGPIGSLDIGLVLNMELQVHALCPKPN